MGKSKSIWLDEDIDEDKLKKVAKEQDYSVSKFVSRLIKKSNYDLLKEKKNE